MKKKNKSDNIDFVNWGWNYADAYFTQSGDYQIKYWFAVGAGWSWIKLKISAGWIPRKEDIKKNASLDKLTPAYLKWVLSIFFTPKTPTVCGSRK